MGQRYVFTGVCLSIGGGGSLPTVEGLHVGGSAYKRGICIQGGLHTGGGVCMRGGESAYRGVCIQGGLHPGEGWADPTRN